jgi:hypothetical protein
MMNYILYKDSGEIIGNYSGLHPEIQEGMHIEGEGDASVEYIKKGILTKREGMGILVSGLIVTGVPSGTKVIVRLIEGGYMEFLINDGEIDLTGSSVGTYKVTLECFPYMPEELEITV